MKDLFFAPDGSASAFATTKLYDLGFVGVVRFAVDTSNTGAVLHECIRYRDTRRQALGDARADAQKLVKMWAEERVRLEGR